MKTYCVIMAGGGGTRYWPLSRQARPKQLLNLSGRDLMVNETIERFALTIEHDNMFIVTNVAQVEAMKKATVGRIPETHILAEPCMRDTAACIGYAATEIIKKYGDGVMCVTPADAYVKDWNEFNRILGKAVHVAEEKDKLVTIGITPTFPSTGYGYIKYDRSETSDARTMLEFKEKPDLKTAESYVASECYLWNSGIFIWKASTILKKFEQYLPAMYTNLMEIENSMGKDTEAETIERVYSTIQKISIDYGIMERSSDVLVVEGEFGWSDVGSWDTLGTLHEADEKGNVCIGDSMLIDTSNTLTYSGKRLIAVIGVDNLVIVESDDAILVCSKERTQDVKKVVEALQNNARAELL